MRFVHDTPGARVLFGAGRRAEATDEIERLGTRALLIADGAATSMAAPLLDALRPLTAAIITEVRQHVPVDDAQRAGELAREVRADCIIAIGGGSTIGLAKAVALSNRLPTLAIPTTFAGSEMTSVWGMTEGGVKTTGRDPIVAPRIVVYDPELTRDLPPSLTASSGLNAIAHCVDALWAPGRSPLTDLMAERGIATLAANLQEAVDGDGSAREQLLVGAWLAGATFSVAGSSVHHKLCHILGGRFDLPHAQTHAVMLPWSTELAVRHMPSAGVVLGHALDAPDPVSALRSLGGRVGAPTRLADLGLSEADARMLADEIDPRGLATPFEIGQDELQQLLVAATVGRE